MTSSSVLLASFQRPVSKKRLSLFLRCAAISFLPAAIYFTGVMRKDTDQFHRPSLKQVVSTDSHDRENAAWDTTRPTCNLNAENKSATATVECFKPGTVPGLGTKMCSCRDGWHGVDCAVPSAVWSTPTFRRWYSEGLIKRRTRPRAVFNGITLNHELDLLEMHVEELSDVVDRYVVVEANRTFFGAPKPLHLQPKLKVGGFAHGHSHKIVPLTLGTLECQGCDPFWPESRSRNVTWQEGQRWLGNVSDDDLFLLTDVDELPNPDVLLFLKYHDGYGEPIGLMLRWFLYGFFWEHRRATRIYAVCTVAFMRTVYADNVQMLRDGRRTTAEAMPAGTGTRAHPWVIEGTRPRFAGWHCSWCFDAKGIQNKLVSSQRDDGVRWGDMAQNTDLAYIESLRREGTVLRRTAVDC
ncbi:hypothetical protein HPB50_014951 [Hyalomma asiaticum]|uniref:Uncharacterized protein n=1 Tax=Hyalomma asiaticum TaxID=266040 RepID=A0ACB7S2R9_HYAAI|nr:hypothetical protein HPB50_014951 [Hyalomma asiaticum]